PAARRGTRPSSPHPSSWRPGTCSEAPPSSVWQPTRGRRPPASMFSSSWNPLVSNEGDELVLAVDFGDRSGPDLVRRSGAVLDDEPQLLVRRVARVPRPTFLVRDALHLRRPATARG